jgi:hypothetical protein
VGVDGERALGAFFEDTEPGAPVVVWDAEGIVEALERALFERGESGEGQVGDLVPDRSEETGTKKAATCIAEADARKWRVAQWRVESER